MEIIKECRSSQKEEIHDILEDINRRIRHQVELILCELLLGLKSTIILDEIMLTLALPRKTFSVFLAFLLNLSTSKPNLYLFKFKF